MTGDQGAATLEIAQKEIYFDDDDAEVSDAIRNLHARRWALQDVHAARIRRAGFDLGRRVGRGEMLAELAQFRLSQLVDMMFDGEFAVDSGDALRVVPWHVGEAMARRSFVLGARQGHRELVDRVGW